MEKITAHIGAAHYKTEIRSTTNTIISDEPESIGGTDLGFAPDELLASSLAACTCITLRMYADRKEWALHDVIVEITFDKSTEEKKTNIIRSIQLFGDLDNEQRSKLLDIADKCPMHKLLSNPTEIKTELK